MATIELITQLQNKNLFSHPVKYFKVIETHISWVILTGDYAYKIKKPVDYQFLDFSTLEKRKFFCEKELELNQARAPQIYQEVVRITGSESSPQINGKGEAIEYALKMREFPQEFLFDQLLVHNKITPEMIDQLAKNIAEFHQHAQLLEQTDFIGSAEQVLLPVKQNFDQIRPLLSDKNDIAQLERLETWSLNQYEKLKNILQQRKEQDFIRACHGDMHLGNIVLYENKPVIFDCIEFNKEFRYTDTMADLGFIAMDLEDNNRSDYARRLINVYFQYAGDYLGLGVLNFYKVYRAIVRAKISLFRSTQAGISPEEKQVVQQKYRQCMALAEKFAQNNHPALVIMCGLSGSGKSTVAKHIVEQCDAIQVRADVERKRLFHLAPLEASHSPLNSHIYSEEATIATIQRLEELTRWIISVGYTVIVDATFLKIRQRARAWQIANEMKVPFIIVYTHAPYEDLKNWIVQRQEKQLDPSEATLEVLAQQKDQFEELTPEEKKHAIIIDSTKPKDFGKAFKQLKNLL